MSSFGNGTASSGLYERVWKEPAPQPSALKSGDRNEQPGDLPPSKQPAASRLPAESGQLDAVPAQLRAMELDQQRRCAESEARILAELKNLEVQVRKLTDAFAGSRCDPSVAAMPSESRPGNSFPYWDVGLQAESAEGKEGFSAFALRLSDMLSNLQCDIDQRLKGHHRDTADRFEQLEDRIRKRDMAFIESLIAVGNTELPPTGGGLFQFEDSSP